MLFAKSFEFGEHDCLGLVPGRVVPFQIEERGAAYRLERYRSKKKIR